MTASPSTGQARPERAGGLPVVDQNRRPLGILTRDNVLRALVRRAR
jgi:CBS domain-containing protein